jgi:CheY-like chemotaxis protein
MRAMLTFNLSSEGYGVSTAASGPEAIKMAAQTEFDLVITDLRMQPMDGVATVKALKGLDPDLEVIIATAYASIETAASCMLAGAFSYIQKPYDLEELRVLIEDGLAKTRRNRISVMRREALALLGEIEKTGGTPAAALSALQRVTGADNSVIVIRGAGGAEVQASTFADGGPGPELLALISANALKRGGSTRLPDEASSPRDAAAALAAAGCGSMMAFRFGLGNGLEGSVALVKSGGPAFTPSDGHLFEILLPQTILALQNRLIRSSGPGR